MSGATKTAGFTLIELLTVSAIVGVLVSISLPVYVKHLYRARTIEARTFLGTIRTAQLQFKATHDTYLKIPIHPALSGGYPSGDKKLWNQPSPTADAATTGVGNFTDLGFLPDSKVYFHYGCEFSGEAARCEAASDLDNNGDASAYLLAWRESATDNAPVGSFSGNYAVPHWSDIVYLTPGRF